MKRFLYIISIFLLTVSCEDLRFGDAFLERPAGNETNIDTVFSCRENAEQALTAAYKGLPDGLLGLAKLDKYDYLESMTDINQSILPYGPMMLLYYTGQLTSATPGLKQRCNFNGEAWSAIRKAWVYIENVHKVPDMTEEEKAKRVGEAKMIIAIQYLEMFRHFGGLPWVGKSYLPSDEMNLPRMTAEETLGKIVDLLDEAAAVLPWSVPATEEGRMTKAGAMGLKVRALLFAASPLFNDSVPYMAGESADQHLTWFGQEDPTRWDDVVTAGLEFMDALKANGGYKLVNTGHPREDFRRAYFDRGNGEVIISTRARTKYPLSQGETNTFLDISRWGTSNVTLDYVDMFPMKDGSDFSWDNSEHSAHPFFDAVGEPVRDPRLYESVGICGDVYQGRTVETWKGGRELTKFKRLAKTGFFMRKFRQDVESTVGKFYSWPMLRLPEIYLSIAEALNEVGRTTEAYKYVAMVRNRVGMPSFPAGLSKEEFREQLIRERALEFAYEEVRYYDLIRWKREDIFKKSLHGLEIISPDKGVTLTFSPYVLETTRSWQGDNWNPKWYLSPFPIDEINKKYGLIQNPGW